MREGFRGDIKAPQCVTKPAHELVALWLGPVAYDHLTHLDAKGRLNHVIEGGMSIVHVHGWDNTIVTCSEDESLVCDKIQLDLVSTQGGDRSRHVR